MKRHPIFIFLFVAYCALLINVLVFKNLPEIHLGGMKFRFGGTRTGRPNLVPFKTISLYMKGRNSLVSWLNLAGNIVLMMPVGFLAPYVFRTIGWRGMLLLAVLSGLSIEILQEIFQVGIFDVDDVILNGLGVVLGYWCYQMLNPAKADE